MKKLFTIFALLIISNLFAQEEKPKEWDLSGAIGLDFSQMIFVNPRFGAGEDKIGIGGNLSLSAKYEKARFKWVNSLGLLFGVQRLGSFRKEIPFQKTVDELRVNSKMNYSIKDKSPFSYALDLLFLSQITPTYVGNLLSADSNAQAKIAQFASPLTLMVSPSIAFDKQYTFGKIGALFSPASFKLIHVSDNDIASRGIHGNPVTTGSQSDFEAEWNMNPDGAIDSTGFYARNFFQFGANLKLNYSNKFFKYTEGEKEKYRLVLASSVNLFSNYLKQPQHIDVEWITNIDLFLFKGLSLSLMTNVFWDYDVFVQVDADNDINTGANGYESKDRRVSFLQSILLKYNFLF